MKARDVMTSAVTSVAPDTPIREVAKILRDHGISAVPVVGEAGAPIGMISEGDLIGRDEADREARRDWWLTLLAEGEMLNADFLASLRPMQRRARDLMAAPVVTVGEETEVSEIARLGDEAKGEFAGRQFHWRVPGEIGFEIVRQMNAQGFDPAFTSVAKIDYALGIPLTHLEIADPVLPIYVNAYLPPQPSMERCYAFGQALARIVSAMGVNTVVLASGGMSHYPGTERYAAPDLAWDREVLARIAAGSLKSLVGYDAAELDAAGNVELRC
jgi:CBS domain-containing protein